MKTKQTSQAPRTAILIRHVGFGDLIWHLPYIRALAESSQGGKLTVIAAPSTMAPEILSIEPCVEEIILFDRNSRRHEQRRATYRGVFGYWKFAQHLKTHNFERIVLFSGRGHHAILAWLANVPRRAGFGHGRTQRLFLNSPPYISQYSGPAVPQYEDAVNFAITQGIVKEHVSPKMMLRFDHIKFGADALAGLPDHKVALIIGTSETHKHWGDENFSAILQRLVSTGHGVILVGGPRERELAERILALVKLSSDEGKLVRSFTDVSILQTAGLLRAVNIAVGNDTGALNLAAANDVPCLCVLGKRPLLMHDPLITCLANKSISEIKPAEVLDRITTFFETLS